MIDETKLVDSEDWRLPLVALIGMGMGRDDLSLRALRWIERARVLAGGERHLDFFPDHPGEKIRLKSPLDPVLDHVGEISREKRTAVLASGDPFFFGIGRRLAERLGRDRILAMPNVTTVQALFARLGEPWEDVKTISLHGRGDDAASGWLRELRGGAGLAFFTDAVHTPAWIAGQLLDAGVTGRSLVVAEDLGLPGEKVVRLSPEEARAMSFSPLNLVAVLPERPGGGGDDSDGSDGPVLGLADEAFQHDAGMITKLEIRAVALAYLQLAPDLVMWDVGAGSGSVSIEAARMAPLKGVFAVEKSPARFHQLVENIRRFRCFEIRPVNGEAPEALDGLPDPDRVFIGGGGVGIQEILRVVESRLRPGGRVVLTAVALDTLEAARSFFQGKPFDFTLSQVQVSRSVPIGKSARLEPINPVFVVSAWRRH
jgi:precorrin-6Y C5,15-methyltransferase (decarboxylating)